MDSPGLQFAKLTFDKLLARGKVNESDREGFYLGVATGIGWANDRLSRRFVTVQQLEKQS